MDAKEHLYYALGSLAYAVAIADGKLQAAEQEKVKELVKQGTKHEIDFLYTDIIFNLLQKEKAGFNEVYAWAMKSFELGKYHFTPEMKAAFMDVIEQVAAAFPSPSPEERALIARFGEDLKSLDVRTLIRD